MSKKPKPRAEKLEAVAPALTKVKERETRKIQAA